VSRRPPVPEQPQFSPMSPARGNNRSGPPVGTPFPGGAPFPGPIPANRSGVGVQEPFPVTPAQTFPVPDARPPSRKTGRPPGHGRAKKEKPARTTRLRGPRLPSRRVFIALGVILALAGVNAGLLVIRHKQAPPKVNVPVASGQSSKPDKTTADVSSINTTFRMGVFNGDRAAVTKWERWQGRKAQDVVFFNPRQTWADISTPQVAEWKNTNYRLIYAIAPIPSDLEPTKEASMRRGARGEYNQYFKTLARNLIAAGQEDAVLRIGWEMQLESWPWGISD
jgi:hypothetical protein